ncbi:MAG: TlpA family protein disulfide reductase, partial [Thermoplasmata archaeon]|nr:TlpA family protein disulfide reductase [Thermoplasmata archaeon]
MVSKARAVVGIVLILFGLAMVLPTAVAVDKTPDVSLVDVDGIAFNLSDYAAKDKVLVLDFMFLSCEPCKLLAHDMKDMYDGDDRDYEILSIDTFPQDTAEQLKAYAKAHGYDWRFTMDTDEQDAFIKNAVTVNPTVIVIDKDGFQTYRDSGTVNIDDLSDEIDRA